jgi:1-acyl-sn-glycerol-3-phosphate acyltransferase
MFSTLRAVWRLASAVLHGLHGLAVVLLRFSSLDLAGRQARIQWWAAGLLKRMGIALEAQGQVTAGGKLLVANHISWLDIVAIHAVCPQARFVSKADVKGWPLVARLVDCAGTLYLQRERKRDAMRVVHQMAEALNAGDTLAVFPEGTTGDGRALLPFHANLLQAAISTGARIQPVALRFSDRTHAVSPAAEFLGETTLAQSLWRLVAADGMTVHVTLLPPRASAHADRRALAQTLREDIAAVLDDRLELEVRAEVGEQATQQ